MKEIELSKEEVTNKVAARVEVVNNFSSDVSPVELAKAVAPLLPFGFTEAMLIHKRVEYIRVWPLSYRQCMEKRLVPSAETAVSCRVPLMATAYVNVENGEHIKRSEMRSEEVARLLRYGLIERRDIMAGTTQAEFFDGLRCRSVRDKATDVLVNIQHADMIAIQQIKKASNGQFGGLHGEDTMAFLTELCKNETLEHHTAFPDRIGPKFDAIASTAAALVYYFMSVKAELLEEHKAGIKNLYDYFYEDGDAGEVVDCFITAFDVAQEVAEDLCRMAETLHGGNSTGFDCVKDLVKDAAAENLANDAIASYLRSLLRTKQHQTLVGPF